MTLEDFMDKLQADGEYECTCFINPPCTFCTDTVQEMYEDWCEENNAQPQY